MMTALCTVILPQQSGNPLIQSMKNARAASPEIQSEPQYLVWTRMQAEAGQGLEAIIHRKERERRASGGYFFWGVGNAPALMITSLARTEAPTPVVFSKMKSRPKAVDQNPRSTVIWRKYIDCYGKVRPLPPYALVTSRGESEIKKKTVHYALHCFSAHSLKLAGNNEAFFSSSYRNAGGRGAPVGASQVTALLVPAAAAPDSEEAGYAVDMRASLTGSYWVKLVDPLPLEDRALDLIERAASDIGDWNELVSELRGKPSTSQGGGENLLLL